MLFDNRSRKSHFVITRTYTISDLNFRIINFNENYSRFFRILYRIHKYSNLRISKLGIKN